MMSRFRDLPIRRKLLVLVVGSAAPALILASAGFLLWDASQFVARIDQDTFTQAKLVADQAAPALEFQETTSARETLLSMGRRQNVLITCLYLTPGDELFSRVDRPETPCPPSTPHEAQFDTFARSYLERVTTSDGRHVGWLYIRRDLSDLRTRMQVAGATVLGFLLLAFVAAFLISTRLQHFISRPLLDLADTARRISSTRDYSLRAVPASNDEIGVVVHAVNDMLDRIAERTSELSRANAELEREVGERRRVEAERSAALERERDANRLKDEFLATLSHELRTPLNAVLGWTRVLQSARVDARTEARALDSIERNARAQARLIEDLLEVSRIVTGKLRLQVADVDLAAIVDAAIEIVQPAAAAKRIRLTATVAERPAMTAGDPDRLQQIVWNILSNAVKFTPPDGCIDVSLDRPDGYRLLVRDSGPGIEPKFLPFVFDPFRQADASASRQHGGLGLGLAIAKQLVELHGGTIRAVAPDHGPGALFEVKLPSVLTSAAAHGSSDLSGVSVDPDPLDSHLLRGVRVLVVDDEEDARDLLKTALSAYGADVVTATSVADAFVEIDRALPHVVLSDIGMPVEDGLTLMRRLRGRPIHEGGATPAVAITAYASEADRRHTHAAGYQAHIAKPYEPADVARVVARLAASVGAPAAVVDGTDHRAG